MRVFGWLDLMLESMGGGYSSRASSLPRDLPCVGVRKTDLGVRVLEEGLRTCIGLHFTCQDDLRRGMHRCCVLVREINVFSC